MTIEVLTADQDGYILAELPFPNAGNVAYRLNEVGKLSLSLPTSHPAITDDNIAIGNYIIIRFSKDIGLPPWAGSIETPRKWTPGQVDLTCYSLEYTFKYLRTRQIRKFDAIAPGSMFATLAREVLNKRSLDVSIAYVWDGGLLYPFNYHFESLWSIWKQGVRKRIDANLFLTPYLKNNRIAWTLSVRPANVNDLTNAVALVEGNNVSDPELEEQGAIFNRVIAVGGGTGWGADREIKVREDISAVGQYGLREQRSMYSSLSSPEALDGVADQELEHYSTPRRRLVMNVTNNKPGLFRDYQHGDVLRVIAPSLKTAGYAADVILQSREYNVLDGNCRAVTTEVREVDLTTNVIEGDR